MTTADPEAMRGTVFVAHLDTGAEYAAVAGTAEAARIAVYREWDLTPGRGDHPEIDGPDALADYFGIRVWELPLNGSAERVD